jgi:release factor glutamine methyltransferase
MHNSKALFHDFLKQLPSDENVEDMQSIALLVFDHLFGLSRTDVLADRQVEVTIEHRQKLDLIAQQITQHKPIQYILGEADFLGRTFFVNANVLIPRPETEELVMLIREKALLKKNREIIRILDIGTGSGCIPISLALESSNAEVFASDISDAALTVAKKNARHLNANVVFIKNDIIHQEIPFDNLDVVVSNPPYITLKEKSQMMKNVVDFEPHLALFVPDCDPLLFYKAISLKSKKALKPLGMLFVEINAQYGKAVAGIFSEDGYSDISIFKDISGKDRIVSCVLR